jgi:predicted CopG family antitoxin
MPSSNKHYKQILIDNDNYNALKELGKTGDSFNSVISKLVKNYNEGQTN